MSGLVLLVLGAWAALIPFIGPVFDYGYTPDKSWTWTAARGWLEVLPGVVAFVAGAVLIVSANRVTSLLGAWLGVLAGGWLVIGRDVATWLHIGSPGRPASSHHFLAAVESLGLFSGVGAVILLFGALALGRLSIRSLRDARYAGYGDGAYGADDYAGREYENGVRYDGDRDRDDGDRLVRDGRVREPVGEDRYDDVDARAEEGVVDEDGVDGVDERGGVADPDLDRPTGRGRAGRHSRRVVVDDEPPRDAPV